MFSALMRRVAAAGDSDDDDTYSGDAYGGDTYGEGEGEGEGDSDSSSSSNSSSGTRWTDAYPCKYYPADDDGCTRPRSCFDCLNVPVDGDQCMVSEYGRCVSKTAYTFREAQDFRQFPPADEYPPWTDQKLQFPADEATYCDAWSDRECAECRASVFADVMAGTANESLTRYCLGERGCVCVALCEAPWWNSTIGAEVCNGARPSTDLDAARADTQKGDGDHGRGSGAQLAFEVIGAVAAVAVVVAVAQAIRRRRARHEVQQAAGNGTGSEQSGQGGDGDGAGQGGPRPQQGPQLSLFGWQAMRSELIEREQLLLAGVEDFSDVRTGYIQLLDVQASAPEEDAPAGAGGASAPVLLAPLAGASAPPMTPTLPSAPDFDDSDDDLDDDTDAL